MTIPAFTSLRANMSRSGEDNLIYTVHIIVLRSDIYLRKTFTSWSDAMHGIAALHLSKPFAENAASRFIKGDIQYGDFVENFESIDSELLGFESVHSQA
jgi:hypothetical protein